MSRTTFFFVCFLVIGLISKALAFLVTALKFIVPAVVVFCLFKCYLNSKRPPVTTVEIAALKAEKEERKVQNEVTRFLANYAAVTTLIPRSRWVLMTRAEKSNVYKRRENLGTIFNSLTWEARARLVQDHGVDKQKIFEKYT